MAFPIAQNRKNADSNEVDVTPTAAQSAGVGFYAPSGQFVIPQRDLEAGEPGAASDTGEFTLRKANAGTAFGVGETLSFSATGVIAGADPLEVSEPSPAGQPFVYAHLKNSGGGGGGGMTVGQVTALILTERADHTVDGVTNNAAPVSATIATQNDRVSVEFTNGRVESWKLTGTDPTNPADWTQHSITDPNAVDHPRTYRLVDATVTGTLPTVPGVIVDDSVAVVRKNGGTDDGTTDWFLQIAGAWVLQDTEPAGASTPETSYALTRLSTDVPAVEVMAAAEIIALINAQPQYNGVTQLENGDNLQVTFSDTNEERNYEISGGSATQVTQQQASAETGRFRGTTTWGDGTVDNGPTAATGTLTGTLSDPALKQGDWWINSADGNIKIGATPLLRVFKNEITVVHNVPVTSTADLRKTGAKTDPVAMVVDRMVAGVETAGHGLGVINEPVVVAINRATGNVVVADTNDQTERAAIGFAISAVDATSLNVYVSAVANRLPECEFPNAALTPQQWYWQQADGQPGTGQPVGTQQKLWYAPTATSVVFDFGEATNGAPSSPNAQEQIIDGTLLTAGDWVIDYALGPYVKVTGALPAGVVIVNPVNTVIGNELTITFEAAQTDPPTFDNTDIAFMDATPTYAKETGIVIKNRGSNKFHAWGSTAQ